jgi:hypothetical protein
MRLEQWRSHGLFRFEIDDGAFERLVENVLTALPDTIASELLPFAILQGANQGGILAHVDSDIIIFDVDKMNQLHLEDDVRIGVIAHELAHFFLEHVGGSLSEEEVCKLEEEANAKASEWGFASEIHALNVARQKFDRLVLD